MSEARKVLVVLRQGTVTPHGAAAPQVKEIVNGAESWDDSKEILQVFDSNKQKIASFRDWSFVKFMDEK
jgi:hypothetical protein